MMRAIGNLSPAERWGSMLAGLGLTLAAIPRGSGARRAAAGIMGLSLLARGAAGHCAMKAALTGESSFREGVRDQWQRMRSRSWRTSAAADIESLEALYVAELQELHSSESQLAPVLEELAHLMPHETLQRQLRGYGTELRTRRADLERILASLEVDARQHPDQAMQAMLAETRKMSQIPAANVRAAALIASLQRLIHYKIAGYGTVATYAKTLGLVDAAARFAEFADRDKTVDDELTGIAKQLVNPEARMTPGVEEAAAAARPH